MNFTLDGPTLIILGVVVLALLVLLVWWLGRWRKSHALKKDFGPEYDHEVEHVGSRTRAEQELEARRARVKEYELRDLDVADRESFALRWREVQKRFVDQPSEAVEEASELIDEAMLRRGYPLGEIQQKQADLSVHHPSEVQDYRKAYDIAGRNRRGEATTEELREATLHYRNLFDHLVGLDETHHPKAAETTS